MIIKDKLEEIINNSDKPLAAHEIDSLSLGTNENTVASRLYDLGAEGRIIWRTRLGKRYKEAVKIHPVQGELKEELWIT